MFGTLRLLLAAMVVASHVGVAPWGLWIGVTAVIIFFLLSGYAMTGLLEKRFPETRFASTFYLERFVRLAPQYYFWLALSLFLLLCFKWQPLKMASFVPYDLLAYLAVVPLGLQRYLGSVDTLVMPQASTLGIEITLYAFSPWILKSRQLSWIAGLLCLSVFGATAIDLLPANIYTYYTSPAPMIYFLLGSFLYKKDWISMAVFASALVAILCYGLPQRFNVEFLVGIVVGLPLLSCYLLVMQTSSTAPLGTRPMDVSWGI